MKTRDQQWVRDKWAKIDAREEKLAQQLAKLQQACQHPDLVKVHKSNTGNYDPSADSYWIEYSCPDCRKRWSEEQ